MSLVKNDCAEIAADVELANTLPKQVIGLMFRRSLDCALIFDMGGLTYDGVHMLFVRFPIDVVFLDGDKKVVDVKAGVRPWIGTAFPRARFRYAIELPAGAVKRYGVRAGDKLSW